MTIFPKIDYKIEKKRVGRMILDTVDTQLMNVMQFIDFTIPREILNCMMKIYGTLKINKVG